MSKYAIESYSRANPARYRRIMSALHENKMTARQVAAELDVSIKDVVGVAHGPATLEMIGIAPTKLTSLTQELNKIDSTIEAASEAGQNHGAIGAIKTAVDFANDSVSGMVILPASALAGVAIGSIFGPMGAAAGFFFGPLAAIPIHWSNHRAGKALQDAKYSRWTNNISLQELEPVEKSFAEAKHPILRSMIADAAVTEIRDAMKKTQRGKPAVLDEGAQKLLRKLETFISAQPREILIPAQRMGAVLREFAKIQQGRDRTRQLESVLEVLPPVEFDALAPHIRSAIFKKDGAVEESFKKLPRFVLDRFR